MRRPATPNDRDLQATHDDFTAAPAAAAQDMSFDAAASEPAPGSETACRRPDVPSRPNERTTIELCKEGSLA